jgi:hypothetical protein
MSQRASLQWSLVVLCFLGGASATVADATAGERAVVIRVYDGAQPGVAARTAAIRTASAILAETGLSAEWHDCTGDAERRQCDHLRGVRSLIVRIAPTLVPGTSASRGSIVTRSRADATGLILGFAVVESATGDGVMATVFMDRVQTVAQRAAVPASALLGRAIAHEVGHLLLATNAHSRSGLMREIWTDAELALGRREDWLFNPSDRSTLLENVTERSAQRTSLLVK